MSALSLGQNLGVGVGRVEGRGSLEWIRQAWGLRNSGAEAF